MRIKKLELLGFKSFKDRTVISFDEGITGIVGPNGCGKSNIVDALVWVMGEMSAKHLRGSSMEDVIFAGSQDYAPLGMAEVSLTLENDGGAFPVKYLNHSEVMVTRRLHRGGESEYFINKEPCRLKDIQEIFMDTGAGSKGFSIIEQGQIGKIITSKPNERRSLIEEAAGITKFKARKKESERKLKSTDQNLVRLSDIIRELKRQLGSLERQAQKAERYRKVKNELRDRELWISSVELEKGQAEHTELQGLSETYSDQDQALETSIQSLQAQVEEEKSKSLVQEKKLEDKQIEFKQFSEDILNRENQIRALEFEIEQNKRSQEIKSSVHEKNEAKLKVVSEERSQITEQFNAVNAEFLELDGAYNKLEQEYRDYQKNLNEKEETLISSRKEQLQTEQAFSHLEVLSQSVKEKIEQLQSELQQQLELKEEMEGSHKDLFKRYNELNKSFEEERQLKLEINKDTEALTGNLNSIKESQEQLLSDRDQASQKYNLAFSKLESLKQLQESFEGYQEGLRNLLLKRKEDGIQEPGLPLGEWIRVPEDYSDSLENSLSDVFQALFGVRSFSEISQSLSKMQEEQMGRAQFFIGQLLDSKKAASQENLADHLIKEDESLKKTLSYFYLVEDLNQAEALLKDYDGFCICKSGEVLSSLGQFYAGSAAQENQGLLQRKESIDLLEAETLQNKTELDSIEKRISGNKAKIEQLSQELEDAKKKDSEQEFRVFEIKKDLERAEYEKEKAQKEIDKAIEQKMALDERSIQQKEKFQAQTEQLKELQIKKDELKEGSTQLEQEVTELKSQYADLQEDVTDKKVRHASLKSQKESLEERLTSLKQNEEGLLQEIQNLVQESQDSDSFISSHSGELEVKKAELDRDIDKRKEMELELAALRDDYERSSKDERELRDQITEKTIEKSKIDSKLNESNLKLEQIKLNLQSLVDQAFERYNVDLTEEFEKYLGAFEAEEKDSVVEKVSELKGKIAKMGEVNLSAIHEFDDIKNRYEFLSEQEKDLLNAKSQLEKVIVRIDKICSRRFRETFEAVNERFKKVFPVLFGGGEAQLILVEHEDPTKEPGIDIEAKPPGKKAQNVSLLSGGEKALTAVSLIFSIFLVKPSPYCLLDEVDAPLDDANVFRFNDLVKEMAKRSQIILVTHNKNTMAVNNKLYGVTQEERGVSKMVSVDLSGNFLKEVTSEASL